MNLFPNKIDKKMAGDAGMGLVLLLLLLGFFLEDNRFYIAAIPVLILNMIQPKIFIPFAWLWFGLSAILGTIMSKIILTLVYFILVVPVGIFRRMIGKDPMQIKNFKKGQASVMHERNHQYIPDDLKKPY